MRGVYLSGKLAFLTLKNRWCKSRTNKHFFHDLSLILLTCAAATTLFFGFKTTFSSPALRGTQALETGRFALFAFFFVTIFISGLLSTLGSIFSAKDRDLILQSPMKSVDFLGFRVFEILLSNFWLTPVFGLPGVFAYGALTGSNATYYVWATFTIGVLFVSAVLLSLFAGLFLASLLPVKNVKETILISTVGVCLGFLFVLERHSLNARKLEVASSVDAALSCLTFPWPPLWANHFLGTGEMTLSFILFPALLFLLLLPFWSFLYARAVNLSFQNTRWLRSRTRTRSLTGWILSWLPSQYRGLLVKEFKTFSRDTIQAVHFMLLLATCVIYLSNLEALSRSGKIPEDQQLAWQTVLSLSNMLYGSLIITAIAARFVLPNFHYEGDAFWMLRASPLSNYKLLRLKLLVWCIPLSVVAAVIFCSGACAIGATPATVLLSTCTGPILSFGIVGLSVCISVFFPESSPGNTGKPVGSLKSLLLVISSCMLTFLSLIPLGVALFFSQFTIGHFWILLFLSGIILGVLTLANIVITRFALKTGSKILAQSLT